MTAVTEDALGSNDYLCGGPTRRCELSNSDPGDQHCDPWARLSICLILNQWSFEKDRESEWNVKGRKSAVESGLL